jgi:hypothetical protein
VRARLVASPFAVAIFATLAHAQGNLSSRLRPITAPIQHAGVYHVATGTWTRNASFANVTGPDVIYNNSCRTGYFASQVQGEKWQHRSRVPCPTGPATPSVFYPAGNDEAPGCQTSYTVNGFEVAYCSSSIAGNITYLYEFADSFTLCATGDMVPTAAFTITSLPGGSPSGGQRCWVVDIDINASTPAFVLSADGDGSWTGPSDHEQFGFSLGPTTAVTAADFTGPIVAGDYTWTGGAATGPLTPCTGTDGTIWDSPINLAESGTGMASSDFFRVTGTSTSFPQGPGCYDFGGRPHADFYLKLFSATCCFPDSCNGMNRFCFPGQAGVIGCPCNNPPAGTGLGCNNFGAGPADSCTLSSAGVSSLAADTLFFISTGENDTSLTIFLQGTTSSHTGIVYGAGVRCVTGDLKRLYTGGAAGGSITRPGAGDPNVHTRSAALGNPILAGQTRYYMTYYRDPLAAGPCGNTTSTFNDSQAGSVLWGP